LPSTCRNYQGYVVILQAPKALIDLDTPLRYPPIGEWFSSVKQPSETPHKGHPKMFPPIFKEDDPLTPLQRLEEIASKVFRTPKETVDTHKPVRPRKRKQH
jgi:hypothetical protein